MSAKTPVFVIGYAPHENIIDPEILADFRGFPVGMQLDLETARAHLHHGVFPPGLVLYSSGKPGRVSGGYGYPQTIEVWE
jgi:hypothetical protein